MALTAVEADEVTAGKVAAGEVEPAADDSISEVTPLALVLADVDELVEVGILENGGNCTGGLAALQMP